MHRLPSPTRLLAAAVAFAAGYVDAVGFLSLGGFFVSFMSGNSTRLGVGLVEGLPLALRAAEVIAVFVVGVALGTRVGESTSHRQRAVLALVAGVLAASALAGDFGFPTVAVLMAALAMGSINAVFGRDAALPVGMTYVSGTLVRLGEALAAAGRRGLPEGWGHYLTHWVALVGGAAVGAWTYSSVRLDALWIAAAWSLALAFWCRRSPLQSVGRSADG